MNWKRLPGQRLIDRVKGFLASGLAVWLPRVSVEMRRLVWRVGIVGLLLSQTPGLDFAQPARAQADASSTPDQVLAQAGAQTFTGRNFEELLAIYN